MTSRPDDELAPALANDPGADGTPLEPALGGLRDLWAIARRAPARAARLEALIRLAHGEDPMVDRALAAASQDPDWATRKYALSGLARRGGPGALPIVVAGLADAHLAVRRAAARALAVLDDGQQEARWLAAAADPDHLVRATAYDALARYGGPSVCDRLLAGLADEAWLVRFFALAALAGRDDARVSPALLAVLADDPALAPHAGRMLARRAAADAAILDGMLALLPAAPPWRRLAIAGALGAVADARACAALADLVGHPDVEVEAAILAQGAAMSSWLQLALADAAWIRRWHACRLLARVGSTEDALAVRPLVQDSRVEVRLAAIEALGALAAVDALPDLQACLHDASWRVREAAVGALGALAASGHALASRAILGATRDDRDEVRQAAQRVLDEATGAATPGAVDPPGPARG